VLISEQHVSAYTVVRAMFQVNGGGSFSAPGAPKSLNRFTWNLACLITSTVRPTCKIWWLPKMGMGWTYGWSCVLACLN